ncbi:MAG: hypothetical protein NTU51_01590 [Bacteroidetes bacterium]|nr:hypothetical protein [Bacteroidota bacterium]
MKTSNFPKPSAILAVVPVFLIAFLVAFPARAQDKKEHKVTTVVIASPSKDNREQKVTVVAKSDSNDKEGKIHLKIIKEVNGKKTIVDTVVSSPGAMDGEELEALMKHVNCKMKDVEEQMKDIELYLGSGSDSAMTDSSGHHNNYMFKFHGGRGCPKICIKDFPEDFNYKFEMPEMPEFSECPEAHDQEFFTHRTPGPKLFSMQKRGESLSDVLGDIPMSRVKSYKIIDKKGGKRIVIDLIDAPSF